MKLTALPQFTRNTKRFTEIVSILGKYGLATWMSKTDPDFVRAIFQGAQVRQLSELSAESRFRLALTELGPTFIKLGQVLSTRPDLVGPALAAELIKLQSHTPADPPDVVRTTIEEELGRPVAQLFATFDDQAVASASIGQVHQATLFDGQPVVVKVQHHGIAEKVTNDLEILIALAELAEQYDSELRLYQPYATLHEFRRNLLRELDFTRERRNIEQFTRNFEHDRTIHLTKTYPELSARRVLTMERLRGVSVSHVAQLEQEGLDTKKIAEQGANIFLNMIFRDRFFHADPHPGNLWVLPGGVIGLLDCGMVGRIDAQTREEVEGMLLAAVEKDAEQLMEFVLRIGDVPQNLNRAELRAHIDEFVAEYLEQSMQDFDLSGAVEGLTAIVRDHHILLPAGLSLLLKVLVMLEGTSRSLNRDFSLIDLLQPYYVKAVHRRISPEKILRRLSRSYHDWERLLNLLPNELTTILYRIREGKFDVNLEHRRLDAIINRLVYGILAAAVFVGACLLLSYDVPPLLYATSIPGASSFVIACYLGVRLLNAIKKSGDLGQNQ